MSALYYVIIFISIVLNASYYELIYITPSLNHNFDHIIENKILYWAIYDYVLLCSEDPFLIL